MILEQVVSSFEQKCGPIVCAVLVAADGCTLAWVANDANVTTAYDLVQKGACGVLRQEPGAGHG